MVSQTCPYQAELGRSHTSLRTNIIQSYKKNLVISHHTRVTRNWLFCPQTLSLASTATAPQTGCVLPWCCYTGSWHHVARVGMFSCETCDINDIKYKDRIKEIQSNINEMIKASRLIWPRILRQILLSSSNSGCRHSRQPKNVKTTTQMKMTSQIKPPPFPP